MPQGSKIDRALKKVKKSVLSNPKYKGMSKERKEKIIFGTLKKMGIMMEKGGHLGNA